MIKIDREICTGCSLCISDCFSSDILMLDGKAQPKNEGCIECGHCLAICPVNAVHMPAYDEGEVESYKKKDFAIDPDRYLKALKYRRTIRQFENRPVEKEKLEQIIQAGRYAPTGGNRQNVSYYVLQDNIEKFREGAIKELKTMADQILSTEETPAIPNIRFYAQTWEKMYDKYFQEPREDILFFDAPVVILVISDSVQNASIAASKMENMVYALDLGMLYSGFFTRAVANSKELQTELGLREGEEVVASLVLGYPKVSYQRTAPRRKAQVTWD